jgi:hypothetical protein
MPHQQADWAPPRTDNETPQRITLDPDERIADRTDLDPNTLYHVVQVDDAGREVVRTVAYTGDPGPDGHGQVTHVTTPPAEPGAPPHVDPNNNIDLTDPAEGVTHRVDLGIGEPHIFRGDEEGRAPSATTFDPPDLPSAPDVHGYDPHSQGPFSARTDLPENSRIAVYGTDGKLHGIFWTNNKGEVEYVRTWYGEKGKGFNPELGNNKTTVANHGVPRPNARFMVEPRDRIRSLQESDFNPGQGVRQGDFSSSSGVKPGTFLFSTDDNGQTRTASGQPDYDAGRRQRNASAQKWSGFIGDGEYGGKFDGGHIFAHEGRGPGEWIN